MSAPVRSFPTIDTGGGIMRRVLSESPEIMLVEVSFPAGAVGEEHSHPHVQSTLVKSGRFEFTVGNGGARVIAETFSGDLEIRKR